jgi:hypothetical protein
MTIEANNFCGLTTLGPDCLVGELDIAKHD